jgi:hypothetical protein
MIDTGPEVQFIQLPNLNDYGRDIEMMIQARIPSSPKKKHLMEVQKQNTHTYSARKKTEKLKNVEREVLENVHQGHITFNLFARRGRVGR